ncbi:chromosome segregation protein SMC [Clostridium sediminicola]|uniref:chromosome segregation protein SMC n=1 Tax=Clostridium sediminicola TaxID=3114879 RepID=UPI0031F23610
MFLKSLEVRGFKSFADKTNIEFKSGITAVVGPNGSGKSNISDSVKWVLGEQSVKNLRGGKMEDVIFAGTQFRKPLGLAQVSLVLDNADEGLPLDYNEVRISRRLYRSGDSEYSINNTKCRLKDIQELFMDTGVGKEGYSIIGQGKIEAILSGRPEERRSLVEEAAGIVKYKTRKNDAEKKLTKTMENLQRVDDIFTTYEERIDPLKIESEKAQKFLELAEELKVKEINILVYTIDEIQQKNIKTKNQLSEKENEIEIIDKENEKLQEKIKEKNKELDEIENTNVSDKEDFFRIKEIKQELVHDNKLKTEKINNLEGFINKTKVEIEEIINRKDRCTKAKSELEKSIDDLNFKKHKMQDTIKNYDSSIYSMEEEITSSEKKYEEKKNLIIEHLRNISTYKNNINLIKNNISNYQTKLEEMKEAYDTYKNTYSINIQTVELLDKEVEKCNLSIQELEEEITKNKKNIVSKKRELTNIQNEFKKYTQELNKMEAHYRMLLDLEKNHEGYNKATKELMKFIDNNEIPDAFGKCKIVGEVIDADEKYETAIEIALGSSISNIITDNDYVAKELIKYLKSKKLGRATFLPMNTIKPRKLIVNNETKKSQGFIGIASDIVNFNEKYTIPIDYLLGRILIVDDLENASRIAKINKYSFKIVTLKGDVVNAGGSFTGGSIYKKSFNVISRKRKIDETKENKNKMKEKVSKLNEEIEALINTIKELDDSCLDLRDKIHYKNIDITKINGKKIAVLNENDKLKKDLSIAKKEMTTINLNISKTYDDAKIFEEKAEELSLKVDSDKVLVNEFEAKIKNMKAELDINKEFLMDSKIELAQNNEIISSKNNELSRIKFDLREISANWNKKKTEIDDSMNNKTVFDKDITENQIKINEIDKQLITFEDKFKKNEIIKIKLKDTINTLISAKEEKQLLLNQKIKYEQKLKVDSAKLEIELEQKYCKLNDEIGLTFAEALDYKIDNINVESFRVEIKEFKSKIKALGVVNVGAIEEYKELLEKYNFLKDQKEDLLNAKIEIESLIEEMTKKMKNVFRENFRKLRDNFNETFVELFKGGHADLILGEGDELTANIDINVQPPGKKLQNINLMSGGEKGLSAIALLFAIQKMKPSPFCILDEIEAALDDANVARFSEFLRKFSDNTQFIIITHRKGTMESCDALYGVTMEEKGVSKIVSVDLNKY